MSKAKILELNDENLQISGDLLKNGKLVAFPTETVYGLGANALDLQACLNIFKAKGRPLTDPLIVHISKKQDIFSLVNMNEKQNQIFELLAQKFWPGPLTMIFQRKNIIPKELTANTDFIGIRMPNHSTALKLIELSGKPIAAPSANLFNHISPVTAKHVFNDFFDQDINIIDDGKTTLGIESTVVKIMDNKLTFYRLGSLPVQQIKKYLEEEKILNLEYEILSNKKKESVYCQAPGQFIKHYSPNIPSFLLNENSQNLFEYNLQKTVLVDFGQQNINLENQVLEYYDLSKEGSLKEAMTNFYYFLRKSEQIKDAEGIIITDISQLKNNIIKQEEEYLDAIYDKMYRSCSGVSVKLNQKINNLNQ